MKYSILSIAILLVGCASVQSLNGGEKDITPPKVVKVYPDSASLNSNTSTINFTFDEYIKTTKVSDLLLISPSQKKSPTVTVKGKKLEITLNDTLINNTTYTIQFNGSVIDNNEGNPLMSYTYIFSTGNYIDSLYYTGVARDIQTNEPLVDCNIHLYSSYNDSNVNNTKPAYVTRTDKEGNFLLSNLPPDSFQAIALQDKNKNLLLDQDELVSLSTTVYPTQVRDTFLLFPNENTSKNKPTLLKSRPGIYKFKNNKHLANSKVKIIINQEQIDFSLTPTKDTIIAYYTPLKDTSNIQLIIDSDTTVLQKITILSKLLYTPKITYLTSLKYLEINSQIPIETVDTTKIIAYLDTIPTNYTISRISPLSLHITSTIYPTQLILLPEAITDVFGNTSKADTFTINPILLSFTTLKLQVNTTDTNSYILQIIRNNKVIKQSLFSSSKQFTFNNLPADDYSVIIITDLNENGLWDTGNTLLSKPPEKLLISNEFKLRENWDKELIINVE
jgi:uncharacterized protein (DUF2141 family)